MNTPIPPSALPIWPDSPANLEDTEEQTPSITPYLLSSEKPTAIVIVCPGGAYANHADYEGEPIAQWLNTLGISAAVLHYRCAPYRHPIPLNDAQRAIRLVRHNAADWNIDPKRVGILGFSAGGHLAASAAVFHDPGDPQSEDPIEHQSSRPDALIACYPVITCLTPHANEGSVINLLGPNPTDQLRQKLSLETQVTPQASPAFIWHTTQDQSVPVQNSLMFAHAYAQNKVPHELHIYPNGDHGLALAQDHPQAHTWTTLCATWLKSLGFIK